MGCNLRAVSLALFAPVRNTGDGYRVIGEPSRGNKCLVSVDSNGLRPSKKIFYNLGSMK